MTPKQQWSELIKNAQSILILPHADPDGDALGSALALQIGLRKLGKEVAVGISGQLPENLSFLPNFQDLQTELKLRKELLIIIDESQARVGNVSLKRLSETKLMVVLTPKEGLLTTGNLRIEEGSFNTDLIITLDCAALELTGRFYEENPDLFYEVPVINVDHHATNTNFGKINIVDVTASSTAEILVSLLETVGKDIPGLLDADISTCLLTGITFDTGSFQNSNTTPKSLTVAAQLVAGGGRQQEIITRLFRTRSLSTLRLWGRALAYIKEDQSLKFAWSVLTKADFVASQAGSHESSGVIDELIKTASGMDWVLLLFERDGDLRGSFRTTKPQVDVSTLARLFGGGGHPQAAAFSLKNATVAEKEQEIISRLRSHLRGEQPSEPSKPSETAQAARAEVPVPAAEPKRDERREPRREDRKDRPAGTAA